MRFGYKGKPDNEPLAIALGDTLNRHHLPKKCFDKLIETKKTEISKTQPKTLTELISRGETTHVNLYIIYLKLLQVKIDINKDQEFLALMENAARCQGLIEYLKLVPYDLMKYRLRLPLDLCERHGISVANIWERIYGKPREEFYDAVLE